MTTTTPDMSLVLPDVSVTAGPQWATLLNAALTLIDSHDHTTGKGVQITPAGLNISSDLTFAQNNATNLRSARLFNNSSFTPGINDRTCLYSLNGELYYIDASGNTVQFTNGGQINFSGSISALNVKDSGFFVQYFGDVTRQFRFDVSAIPTSTSRILAVPDAGANDTFVLRTATQTLTNKTLTTPVIASVNTGSTTFALPSVDGGNGQVLSTNGSGTLSFIPVASSVGNVAANDSNVTFTNASNRVQYCFPTAARTYTMPTTGISAGDTWTFFNQATTSTPLITIQSSGANTIDYVLPNGKLVLIALTATPTTAAHWLVIEAHSDWVSYTPTFSAGYGTVINISFKFRRVRDSVEIAGKYQVGTVAASQANFTLPYGFSINTTKLVSTNTGANAFGVWYNLNIAGDLAQGGGMGTYTNDSTAASVVVHTRGGASGSFILANGTNLNNSNVYVAHNILIPISGWN